MTRAGQALYRAACRSHKLPACELERELTSWQLVATTDKRARTSWQLVATTASLAFARTGGFQSRRQMRGGDVRRDGGLASRGRFCGPRIHFATQENPRGRDHDEQHAQ